ncbi:peptide-methionine (S)-S-oxide reductase MsrA [Halobacteriovorax marinus]|uniref:peptide-methionine (S)-S-oxide reductase MsrA n=1 Tax=Halobacteriovorax marinus TaxID=97084 RepID=UPI003A9356E4
MKLNTIFLLISLYLAGSAQALAKSEVAIFAGGCFWCMEPPFDKLKGVKSTTSGYIGGSESSASYKVVSAGGTGHTEAVKIEFDPAVVNYSKLLEVFWMNIDPTDNKGQFVDRGSQYRPGVFYTTESQRELALKSRDELEKSKRFSKKIVAEITKASQFYPAEDYHQDYYEKNPIRYKFYRFNSGRDQFLRKYWKK